MIDLKNNRKTPVSKQQQLKQFFIILNNLILQNYFTKGKSNGK